MRLHPKAPSCDASESAATARDSAATASDASDQRHAIRDDSRACSACASSERSCLSRMSLRMENHSDSSTGAGAMSSSSNCSGRQAGEGSSPAADEPNMSGKPLSATLAVLSRVMLAVSVASLAGAAYGFASGNSVASIIAACSAVLVLAVVVPVVMTGRRRER